MAMCEVGLRGKTDQLFLQSPTFCPPQNKDEHTMRDQIGLYIMPWPDPQARFFCEPTKY